jgi:hypothetical protein
MVTAYRPTGRAWDAVGIVAAIQTSYPHANEHPGSRLFEASAVVVRCFYGAQAALLLYTLIAQCLLTHHQGRSLANTFSYFTIQSNVLVLVTGAVLAVRPNASGAVWRVVRLAALCGITVTGLVYVTLLAPYVHLSGWALAYNYVFHYVMPTTTVIGFVLIGPRLRFRPPDFVYMAWPVLYLVYTMVRGAVFHPEFTGLGEEEASSYPYRFLDVDRVSIFEVVASSIFVAVLLVGCGLAYVHGERWLESRIARRARPH